MKIWPPLLLVLLVQPGCASESWRGFYGERRTEQVPADVRRFVIATDGCRYFDSEEPFDEERRADLQRTMDASCIGLVERRAALFAKYADRPVIVRTMEQAWCDEDVCEEPSQAEAAE